MENNFESSLFLDTSYTLSTFSYLDISVSIYSLRASVSDYDLTGQLIWPAAKLLSEYIIDQKSIIKDKNIIELGAGAGLTGFIASNFAKNIYITDGNEIVMDLLEINRKHLQKDNVKIKKLIWGEDFEFLENNIFDVVIAADVLFWPGSILPLVITYDKIIEVNPKVKIIMALCKRSNHTEKNFDEELEKKGLVRNILVEKGNEFIYEIIKKI